ncbi:MAG: ferritin-like protein [Psychrosphaera sp.]|nr:ferritin-like protein [Psychrosphaera sp.]
MSDLKQDKEALCELLQQAIEFELSTIPPYMTALISILPKTNRVSANIIREVMMEEMLHMTLAGNVLSSIGGKLVLNSSNTPQYPLMLEFEGKCFKDREFDVDLARFSAKNIEVFTQIELPDGWAADVDPIKATAEIEVPGYTIGEFYQLIENKLAALCDKYGESVVFTGDLDHQINVNYYWSGGGQPIKVTNLCEARLALKVIVTQGEGTPKSVYDGDAHYFDQPKEVAHFFRFREILFGRHYQSGDDPKLPPTGERFEVDYNQVYPILPNAKSSDYSDDLVMAALNRRFNKQYATMLTLIAEGFNGSPGSLYAAILNGMHDMVPIAQQMVATPIIGREEFNGTPSFEWVQPD